MDDKKNNNVKPHTDKPNGDKTEPKLKKEADTKELEECKGSLSEYKHKYLRALADYQNFEKRVKDEKELIIKNANSGLILKLLPFLDSLDKAELFYKDQGLKMIKDQFIKTLKETGLEEISVMGKEFDPYVAEVVDISEGEKDNMVIEVLLKGYRYNGKVLRIAQVKVSKRKQNS